MKRRDLANEILSTATKTGFQKGQPVCLGVCHAGHSGVAQELSNILGSPVTAGTGQVRFNPDTFVLEVVDQGDFIKTFTPNK